MKEKKPFQIRTALKKLLSGSRVRLSWGQTVFHCTRNIVYLKYPGLPKVRYGTIHEFTRWESNQTFVVV